MQSLDENKEMEGLTSEQQSQKAIYHALDTICSDWCKWYLLGNGTQTHALLTEAFATIKKMDVEAVRKNFEPRGTRPEELQGGRFVCRKCGADFYLKYSASFKTPERCPYCPKGRIDLY